MSNNTRWTQEEELMLLKSINNGHDIKTIANNHNRSVSAIDLRLKKIIYENAISNVPLDTISKKLNIPVDKITQHYYSYKDFIEKNKKNKQIIGNNIEPNITKEPIIIREPTVIREPTIIREHQSINQNNFQIGGRRIENDNLKKIEEKLKKLEMENKILKLIVENKDLTHKLNDLIKDGKVDKNVKNIIKIVRKSNN